MYGWETWIIREAERSTNWKDVLPRVPELFIQANNRLLWDEFAITTKGIYLYTIGRLNPWEITDKIFMIKKTDDEGQIFETIVSNN